MNVKPLSNRVLVRPETPAEKSKGGIVLPDMAKERPQRGKVLAAGPGKVSDDGQSRIPMSVSVGDIVLFTRYSGNSTKELGDDLILSEEEILAVVLQE